MGWFTHKKRELGSSIFKDFIDYHNHILFGVDDGVENCEESIAILTYYEQLGVKKVILTPHIQATLNDWEMIERHFEKLKNIYMGNITISLAAEYMLDAGFRQQLEIGLRPIEDDKVLVESSYFNKTPLFDEMLYQMSNEGFIPVIAHPERYLFLNYKQYDKLKDCDYQLQLNILSLTGYYGNEVKKRAQYLLNNGMYNFVGSDLHKLDVFREQIVKIKLSNKELQVIMHLSRDV